MSKAPQKDPPSVKAVLAYAKRLRERSELHRIKHPMEPGLYSPSNDAARKVSQQYGPERALEILAQRARCLEMRAEEEANRARAARATHRTHLLIAKGERTAELERLSLGRRLDQALLRIAACSQTKAASGPDSGPVSGSRERGVIPRLDRDNAALENDAERVVARAEREAQAAIRRMIEEEAAA